MSALEQGWLSREMELWRRETGISSATADDAIRIMEDARERCPESDEVARCLGRTYLSLGSPAKAALIYKQLLEQHPRIGLYAGLMGSAYYQAGDLGAALESYQLGCASRPARYGFACMKILRELGREEDAEAYEQYRVDYKEEELIESRKKELMDLIGTDAAFREAQELLRSGDRGACLRRLIDLDGAVWSFAEDEYFGEPAQKLSRLVLENYRAVVRFGSGP